MKWIEFKNENNSSYRIGIYKEVKTTHRSLTDKVITDEKLFVEIQGLNNDKWEQAFKQDITNKTFYTPYTRDNRVAEELVKILPNEDYEEWLLKMGKYYFVEKKKQAKQKALLNERIEIREV